MDNTKLSKFCKRFYGQDSSSHKGKYRHHRHGLLDDIPYRKLIRGVIILRSKDLKTVEEFLGQYSAETHIRTIILADEDCKILGLRIK